MTCAIRTPEYKEGFTETAAEGSIRNAADVRNGTTLTRSGRGATFCSVAGHATRSFGFKHHVVPAPLLPPLRRKVVSFFPIFDNVLCSFLELLLFFRCGDVLHNIG